MGERRFQPKTTDTPKAVDRPAGGPGVQGRGNGAAQAGLARQGQALAPGVKQGITHANIARYASGNGVKLVDRAAAAATGTDRLLGDTDAGKALGGVGKAVGGGLSAAGHFAGDRMVTDSLWGHAATSAAKGAMDTAISAAAGGGPLAALPGIVDAMVPQDSAWKPVTATAAEASPITQLQRLMGAGMDGLAMAGEGMAHGQSGLMRSADVMEDNAVDGNYGHIIQGLTALRGQVTGDSELADKFTGPAAERGDRGMFVAAGNAIGDETWRVKEAIRTAPETYERAQQGIHNAAGVLLEGQSAEEMERSRRMNAALKDRWIR